MKLLRVSQLVRINCAAAAASVNFGWRGGAPNFFRRRRRGRVPAGCGGGIRRLRGLPCTSRIAALYYRPTEYNESFWLETLATLHQLNRLNY